MQPTAQTPNQIAAAQPGNAYGSTNNSAGLGSNTSGPNGVTTNGNGTVVPPTSAPTGQTSTSQPPSSPVPTAVVSSSTAANNINGTIIPAMQSGQASVAAASAAKASNPGITNPSLYYGNAAGTPTFDSNGNPIVPPQQSAPVSTQSPEQQVASNPDTGNRFVYDAQGNQVEIGINDAIPTGYSAVNPKIGPTTPIEQTTIDPLGNQYVQYSDGTYGKYNAAGQYIGTATASDFSTNQAGQDLLSKLNSALSGSYPLTASQQAQVQQQEAKFQSLINQQTIANANFTGGTTVAENLYGMGNSLTGLGEIKGTVDAGIAKIADLNSQMVSAVDQMTDAFNTDNLSDLKDAYDLYTSAAKDRQTELDNITKAGQDAQDKVDAAVQKNKDDVTSVLADAQKAGAPPAVLNAIQNSPDAASALTAAGDYLQTSSDPTMNKYIQYRNDAQANGLTPQDFATWKAADDAATQKEQAGTAYATAFATAAGKNAADEQAALENSAIIPVTASNGIIYNIPSNLAPYMTVSSSGKQYFDISGLTASDQKKVIDTAPAGTKFITQKNDHADLTNISEATSNISDIKSAFDSIAASSPAARDLYAAGTETAAAFLQSDPTGAAVSTFQASIPVILKAINGVQGSRLGGSAISADSPLLPKITDTIAIVNAKMANLQKLIDNRQTVLIGNPTASEQALLDGKNNPLNLPPPASSGMVGGININNPLGI